jgi:hypothetical protein
MLRLASDADFNADILRGLFRRQPDLNLIRVRDVGLQTADDKYTGMGGRRRTDPSHT